MYRPNWHSSLITFEKKSQNLFRKFKIEDQKLSDQLPKPCSIMAEVHFDVANTTWYAKQLRHPFPFSCNSFVKDYPVSRLPRFPLKVR